MPKKRHDIWDKFYPGTDKNCIFCMKKINRLADALNHVASKCPKADENARRLALLYLKERKDETDLKRKLDGRHSTGVGADEDCVDEDIDDEDNSILPSDSISQQSSIHEGRDNSHQNHNNNGHAGKASAKKRSAAAVKSAKKRRRIAQWDQPDSHTQHPTEITHIYD